jgi:hypothetical protein
VHDRSDLQAMKSVTEAGTLPLRGGAHEHETPDQHEKEIILEPVSDHADAEDPGHDGGGPSGTDVVATPRQQRTEDAPAVHRQCRQHVEAGQREVQPPDPFQP